MAPLTPKTQPEREDTDLSLRAERTKTDAELAAARGAIEEDADQVVELARDRAEAVLEATRTRADKKLEEDGANHEILREVEGERADEDRAFAEERETADERLHVEREQRERALRKLLSLERDATDERLQVERIRSDESLAARDDFLGMVSHDLRTLLGGIALNAALLAKHATAQGEAGAEALNRADRIQRFTARMNRLIGDLLDVVSLEAGKLEVSPRPHDAVQLVRDAMEAFQPSFAAKGLTLTSHIASGSLLAEFDHERVLQVLANLLSNALKFTQEGGQVALTVQPQGPMVRFSLTDTGVGIPEHELAGVFERFRQIKAKDRRGLGLGLYIARCIVEAHGGEIWAEPQEAGGIAFHFTLPGVAAAPA